MIATYARLRPLFVLLGVLAAQGIAHAEEAPNAALVAAIDALVKKQGITPEGPGVAILVVQPGQFVFKKGYGAAHLQDHAPITSQTMFELASVSKSFTATAILILHERGKLSIHDDVRKYLHELPEYNKQRPIHITDLLQHTSGLPDYMDFENVPSRHKDYWVNEDYIGEFARQRVKHPPVFPTGQKYEYSNTNYMLLATIVERVAKKSYAAFMHEEVFTPAGMKHTFVYDSPNAVPKKKPAECLTALGYDKEKNKTQWKESWGTTPFRHEKLLTVGDGAIWTNLDDMIAWDAALRADKLIKKETMQLALTQSKTRDGKKNDYGFGWSMYYEKDGKMIGYGHDGSWGGFHTSYYRYLAADRTTVILSNNGTFDTDKLWYALNDVIEKHKPGKK